MPFLSEVFFELLGSALYYPVRDRHPVIVCAYTAAVLAAIIGLCLLIRHLIPDDPFR